jgi:hypothetical protein
MIENPNNPIQFNETKFGQTKSPDLERILIYKNNHRGITDKAELRLPDSEKQIRVPPNC